MHGIQALFISFPNTRLRCDRFGVRSKFSQGSLVQAGAGKNDGNSAESAKAISGGKYRSWKVNICYTTLVLAKKQELSVLLAIAVLALLCLEDRVTCTA